ncbi:hypothetical protein VTK26DRAFT_5387 [Humicola hyalothermophila]
MRLLCSWTTYITEARGAQGRLGKDSVRYMYTRLTTFNTRGPGSVAPVFIFVRQHTHPSGCLQFAVVEVKLFRINLSCTNRASKQRLECSLAGVWCARNCRQGDLAKQKKDKKAHRLAPFLVRRKVAGYENLCPGGEGGGSLRGRFKKESDWGPLAEFSGCRSPRVGYHQAPGFAGMVCDEIRR